MRYHKGMTVQLTSNVSLSNGGAAFTNTLTIPYHQWVIIDV